MNRCARAGVVNEATTLVVGSDVSGLDSQTVSPEQVEQEGES
jgi:hypothetical protein